VLAGGKLSLSVPDNLLRFALATVLGLSGLKLGIGMTALLVYIGRCRWVRYSRRYGGGRPVVEPRVGTEAA
jgi:hypothetical protein